MRLAGHRGLSTTWARALLLAPLLCCCLAEAGGQPVLYSVVSREWASDGLLNVLDPDTAGTLASIPMTMAGETVEAGNGLATHPSTGQLWAILKLVGQTSRELAIVDPGTGVATSIGDTGERFAGIAFDSSGNLYGLTGDGGNRPESLFMLDQGDGTPTFVMPLGRGEDGEALAFNPVDGRFYHASGRSSDLIFESFVPTVFDVLIDPQQAQPGPLFDDDVQAITHWGAQDVFLWSESTSGVPGELSSVTPVGVGTPIGALDHDAQGLAIVGPDLYSVASGDDLLRRVDPATAATLASQPITLAGETVLRGYGLATHPGSGELWAVLELQGQVFPELATLDPITGVATRVGDLGDSFEGLAFNSAGTLHGVTGEQGNDGGEMLFVISQTDASSSFVMSLGDGENDGGEALAFRAGDGRFYHASGNTAFESFVPTQFVDIPVNITDEVLGLTYWVEEGVFLWSTHDDFYRVTPGGAETLISNPDPPPKGLAFTGSSGLFMLGDCNRDGVLGAPDLVAIAQNAGRSIAECDGDLDGIVDPPDDVPAVFLLILGAGL